MPWPLVVDQGIVDSTEVPMVQLAGLVFFGVSAVLFGIAALSNPSDGRLVPGGGCFLALGSLAVSLPG